VDRELFKRPRKNGEFNRLLVDSMVSAADPTAEDATDDADVLLLADVKRGVDIDIDIDDDDCRFRESVLDTEEAEKEGDEE
jgi:hypothetical protein